MKKPKINANRMEETFNEMARIGATNGGGLLRLALSEDDIKGRNLLVSWMKEAGLEVSTDFMANIFGRREGGNPDAPPVIVGSHIDSQPYGGKFDGALGVMGGLEVMRTLNDFEVETEHPVILASWTNEEGARFAPPLAGSGVWAGCLDKDEVLANLDQDGVSFASALEKSGYQSKGRGPAKPIKAYFEYHIEQGPVLEEAGKTIGVPKGVLDMFWFAVRVTGDSNQAGPTPMDMRKDPMCAAAEIILAVNRLPEVMGGDLVATVGEIRAFPNVHNTIAGEVLLQVDIRAWDPSLTGQAWKKLQEQLVSITSARGCGLETKEIWHANRVEFDAGLRALITEQAGEQGYSHMECISGAGHDTTYLSTIAPTAMIFIPSIGGRSHVEVENSKWEDCLAGASVLLNSVMKTAGLA